MPARKRIRTSSVNDGTASDKVKLETGAADDPQRETAKRPRRSKAETEIEIKSEEPIEAATRLPAVTDRTPSRKRQSRQVKEEPEADRGVTATEPATNSTPQKRSAKPKVKAEVESESQVPDPSKVEEADLQSSPKPKKTRAKSKADAEPAEPLKMRNAATRMFVGAHVSMAKSIANAVSNANHIGANAFAMFLKNQRKWESPQYNLDDVLEFRKRMKEFGYDGDTQVLPHGSYLINLANDDAEKRQQAYGCFYDDLKRCEQLGVARYNFHPGSTASCSREKGIENLAGCINKAIEETNGVKIVVENMAGHGNIIGGPLEELASLLEQVKRKDRIGFCLDTCHLFAAGHDIRTQEKYDALLAKFDELIGLDYLAGWHLNDSKADLGANKDLHQNIGLGYLGLEPFRCIMNDKRLEGMPLILETPADDSSGKEDRSVWAKEIELLEWLIGKASDDPEVLSKAAELFAQGAADREKALGAATRKAEKQEKDAAKAAKATTKAKKQTKLPGAS